MRPDHYATLGVAPGASAAEVRAAYLKLLREFHPDRNRSPEAIDRTKAIITAFKVLGDFDQRNYYDWDRRREREAAEAAAAQAPRRRARAGIAAIGIALAAVGAWLLMLDADPKGAEPIATIVAAASEPKPAAPIRTAAAPPTNADRERDTTDTRTRTVMATEGQTAEAKSADRLASREPQKNLPAKTAPAKAASNPIQRMAVRNADAIRPGRVAAERAPSPVEGPSPVRTGARPAPAVRVAAKPVTAPPRPVPESARQSTTQATTDLASLDQFVMNFYSQSWRYGDAPKRSKLEQTKAGFVVRRGACVAEECKRAAYLKLMRDVSQIVQSDQPKAR